MRVKEVDTLMRKGEENLTEKDTKDITAKAKVIQEYEKIHYPFPVPKTITEIVELKMFEKKLNRVKLAKKLGVANSKLSQILNGKRQPDVKFFKAVHEKLGIDGNFILESI